MITSVSINFFFQASLDLTNHKVKPRCLRYAWGDCGKKCFTLVCTVNQLPCVEGLMPTSLKLQGNLIIFKDYFILPVADLNVSFQDTPGMGTPIFDITVNCMTVTVAFQHD